jgi:transposase
MTKRERRVFTDEFKREAVRLIETSGRTVSQIAEDLGIGLSTLTRWKRIYQDAGPSSEAHMDLSQELVRLRKENSILRQEREILKRAATFFAKEGSQ